MILEYLNSYAQKAYREIMSIVNDPNVTGHEANYNHLYIHGFNKLLKHNRISLEKVVEVFSFVEENIELYLKKHYIGKDFALYVNADALIPAFTMTIVSYYKGTYLKESVPLADMVSWYQTKAYFDGIEIIEDQIKSEDSVLEESIEVIPDSIRTYIKVIHT